VTNSHVYNPHSPQFKHVLNHLQNGKISEACMKLKFVYSFFYFMYFFAGEMAQGTQIKVILNLPNGFQGLLKPYRFFF